MNTCRDESLDTDRGVFLRVTLDIGTITAVPLSVNVAGALATHHHCIPFLSLL